MGNVAAYHNMGLGTDFFLKSLVIYWQLCPDFMLPRVREVQCVHIFSVYTKKMSDVRMLNIW